MLKKAKQKMLSRRSFPRKKADRAEIVLLNSKAESEFTRRTRVPMGIHKSRTLSKTGLEFTNLI